MSTFIRGTVNFKTLSLICINRQEKAGLALSLLLYEI